MIKTNLRAVVQAVHGSRITGMLLAGVMCLPLLSRLHGAEGVFIYGSQKSQPKSGWIAVEYNSFRRIGAVTKFRTASGTNMEITKFQPLEILPYVDLYKPGLEIRASMAGFWAAEYNTYKDAYNAYPRARIYLDGQVKSLKDISENLAQGNAWFEGKWVNDASVDEILAKRASDKRKRIEDEKEANRVAGIQAEIDRLQAELTGVRDRIRARQAAISTMEGELEKARSELTEGSEALNRDIKNSLESNS